jgi:predicted nucleotidyltransferase
MTAKAKVVRTLQKEMPYLRDHFGVKKLALFGSLSKKSHVPPHDVDILIEFIAPIGFRFIDLANYLEKKLGKKTDILTTEGLSSIRVDKVARSIKDNLYYV